MIYQCTKDMLKALKTEPAGKPDIFNKLFAWNVKIMKIGRRNLVYLMNDALKLSVILYGVTYRDLKYFDYHVRQGVVRVLEDCNVSSAIVHQYLEQAGEYIITKSGTSKQLGVLNLAVMEVEYYFEDYIEETLLQRRLCEHQNSRMVKNDSGDYVRPQEITKNLLEKFLTDNAADFDLGEIAIYMFNTDRMGMLPFLNKRDASIVVCEDGTDEHEKVEYDDDYIHIRLEYDDFFRTFYRFAGDIRNLNFQHELNIYGHGKGAIRRIKELLYNYPDVQKGWYEYKNVVEQKKVKQWLESLGLM